MPENHRGPGFFEIRYRKEVGIGCAECHVIVIVVFVIWLSVRLHDSIQDEGFHYLVFDL